MTIGLVILQFLKTRKGAVALLTLPAISLCVAIRMEYALANAIGSCVMIIYHGVMIYFVLYATHSPVHAFLTML